MRLLKPDRREKVHERGRSDVENLQRKAVHRDLSTSIRKADALLHGTHEPGIRKLAGGGMAPACRRDGRAVLLVAPSMSRALNGN